jgi:hypothetical protein
MLSAYATAGTLWQLMDEKSIRIKDPANLEMRRFQSCAEKEAKEGIAAQRIRRKFQIPVRPLRLPLKASRS